MQSKHYFVPSVGNLIISKHSRATKLSIKLKPGCTPKVTIPYLVSFDMGFRFAMDKKDWIIEHLALLKEKTPRKTIFSKGSIFHTRFHIINIQTHQGHQITTKTNGSEITLFLPEDQDPESEKSQTSIRGFITEVLRKEAKLYLPERVKEWATKYRFSYHKITVKNLKSRWGSCSSKNNINLNLHLMRLPEHLSDFIILHELCHTVHRNHGVGFHQLLNQLVGDEKRLNKELRNFTIEF